MTTISSVSSSNPYATITLANLNNVSIIGLTIKGGYYGINEYNSSYTIAESIITENIHGIVSDLGSSPLITRNSIINNSGFGIVNLTSSSFIAENLIKGHGYDGILIFQSSPIIRENTVIMNGILNGFDIDVSSSGVPGVPNISFNIYDSIYGDTGVGQYNVKSDGSLAPAP